MTKQLYLMRHGETLFNVLHRIQGACDSPLTDLGIKQAEVAGEFLQTIDFDHYYTSTSERACDTLTAAVGDVPYKRLKGLKEMNFGVYEGESEALNPEDKSTFFVEFGGESRKQVNARMVKTCLKMMNQPDNQTVLAVSHAGAGFHFMEHWESQATMQKVLKDGFGNCTIAVYDFDEDQQQFSLKKVIRETPFSLDHWQDAKLISKVY